MLYHLHALMVLAALGTVNKRCSKSQLYGLIFNKPSWPYRYWTV